MTSLQPLLILFKPAAHLADHFASIISQLSVAVTSCTNLNQLPACLRLYPEHCPVICMPFVLEDGRSGINETMLLKQSDLYKHFQILGLLPLYDKISLHSYFSAGADMVMQPPFDPDLISLQLHALAQRSNEISLAAESAKRDQEISRSALGFLDTARDGVLILDEHGTLLVANRAAERILAFDREHLAASYQKIASQFVPHIQRHLQQEDREHTAGQVVSTLDATLTKSDGRSVPLLLRITSLMGAANKRIGLAIGLGDLSIPRQIATRLSNVEQIRSLALTLAAGTLHTLNASSLGVPGHPLNRIEQILNNEGSRTNLSQVITPLLELVDLILPKASEVRVDFKEDCVIIGKRSDLFQLLGSLLLYAADRAGASGETLLETKISVDRQQVAVVLAYTAHELIEPISGDYLMSLVQGDHNRFLGNKEDGLHALKYAQQFASKLGITVEAKQKSRWQGKIRVVLPCIASEVPLNG